MCEWEFINGAGIVKNKYLFRKLLGKIDKKIE